MIPNIVADWELYTQKLTEFFVSYYFGKADWYWIGDEIGGVIDVCDRFFSVEDMVDFLRYNYSKKKMLAFMDELSENNFERKYSIKAYKLLK